MVSCSMASFSCGAGMSTFQLVLGGKTTRQVGIVEDGETGQGRSEHPLPGVMEALSQFWVRQTVDKIQVAETKPQLRPLCSSMAMDEAVVLLRLTATWTLVGSPEHRD